ncbi:MAG: hypothetical protein AB1816_07570 [Bacillota bacterium]
MELEVHPGFPDALSARAWVESLGLEPGLCALVRFLGVWYAVIYDTLEREVMAGSQLVWFTRNLVLECVPTPSFRLPYPVRKLSRAHGWSEGVWEDLLRVDPGLGVYLVRYPRLSPGLVEVTRWKYARPYAILLGITFYDRWWSLEDCSGVLRRYFTWSESWPGWFRGRRDVVGINPFRSLVFLRDGSVCRRRFWEPLLEGAGLFCRGSVPRWSGF